jgi:hypothetical protein
MGTINKSGQAGITNGRLGTTTNYSLGSTGTTKYSLNPNGGLVTTQYVIAGVPFTKTIRAGDSLEQNWTLGRLGSTTYNMGAGNSKTLKYTLDPSGDVTESNGRLSGRTGTASYTLGSGSSSKVNATLGAGSTQAYTLASGGSSTIKTTINGVEETVTLAPGDSATTIITEGAQAALESNSTYDPDTPPVESMEYNVGDDGFTDNTFGDDVWRVWILQPYNIKEKTDYGPICVVMPAGEYDPGCPGRLPSFIQSNGDYPPNTNCRYILVGSARKSPSTGLWVVEQNAVGTLTIPTDDRDVYIPDPPDLQDPYINQYQVKVETKEEVDGDVITTYSVLKIGRGGNVWNPSLDGPMKHSLQKRVDVITVDSRLGRSANFGTDETSPWANNDGYFVLSQGVYTYVYAFKITYNQGETTDYYIYVSEDDELAPETGAIGIPPGISAPSGEYQVDGFLVGEVNWTGMGVPVVQQRVVGAITWPPYIEPRKYQPFEVVVAPQGDEVIDPDSIQIVKGDILWTNSKADDFTASAESDFKPPLQGQAIKAWVYPTGSLTAGSDFGSPFINNGGRFHLERNEVYNLFIIGNQDSRTAGSQFGNVTLALIADGSDAYDKTKPFYAGWMGRTWKYPFFPQYIVDVGYVQQPELYGWALDYNCQRYLVARIYHNEVKWVVDQRLYGPVTISDDLAFGGFFFEPEGGGLPTRAFQTEQDAWGGAWVGYTKDGNPDNCTIQVRPWP